jgi:hypothetical protein
MRPPVDAGSDVISRHMARAGGPPTGAAGSARVLKFDLVVGRTRTALDTARSPLQSEGWLTSPCPLAHIVVLPPPSRFMAFTAPRPIISCANRVIVIPTDQPGCRPSTVTSRILPVAV